MKTKNKVYPTTKIFRIGEEKINNYGNYKMKIIEYINEKDIYVQFQDKHKSIVHTNYHAFIQGKVKNPFYPYVYGIGYIGECSGKLNNKIDKQAYKTWFSMLKRCYDEKSLKESPTYKNCSVCVEWHNFKNFRNWYIKNYYELNESLSLDKDILFKNNKIYSPKNCLLVPKKINSCFIYAYKDTIHTIQDNNKKYYTVQLGNKKCKFKTKKDTLYQRNKFYNKRLKNHLRQYKGKIPNELYKIIYDKIDLICGEPQDED